ncbi:MAG: tetratricopeptide repeat protein [Bacteroidetes bacterium]|nr:tetratricopeptide repeat protein [Bacteroidota bacterium]
MRIVRISTLIIALSTGLLITAAAYSQSVTDKISKSLKLIELGNTKQALADLQQLAAANPKSADALGALSMAMIEAGKPLPDIEKQLATAYDIDRKSIYVRIGRGQLFGKQEKREDAVKEFRAALKLDDKNIVTYLALARYYLAVDSLKAAEVTLYQAQGVSANDVRPYLGLAELYEKQRITVLAIQQYEQAKKLDPNDISVLAKLAGLYYRARKYDESINEWIKITKMDSSYSPAYYEVAWIFFRSRQFANAAKYAEKYHELDPTDMDGTWLAAQALSESGQYQKALPYLEQSSSVDSLKGSAQNYLARSYFFSGQFDKAIEIFKQAKNLTPYDLYYWGYSLISKGDTVDGIAKWKESFVGDTIRKKDEKTKVYQQIISLYSSMKRWGDAAETYKELNTLEHSSDNLIKAGQLYVFGKMYDSARSVFTLVLQKDPKNVNGMIGLADVDMAQESTLKDAESLLDQAAALATTKESQEMVGEAYARLGLAYYTAKNFDRCILMLESQHAQKYLSASSPYMINIYKVLGGGYLQLKKYDKAEEAFKKALQINPKDEDAKKGLDFIKQVKGKK